MKKRLSITIEQERITELDEILRKGIFRNKSHILEYALIKFLESKNEIIE